MSLVGWDDVAKEVEQPCPAGVRVFAPSGELYRFVVVDLLEHTGDWDGAAGWTTAFVTKLHEHFIKENDRIQPSVLVVGKALPFEFRQKVHSAGSVVYDLDLPSNAQFESSKAIVSYLSSVCGQPAQEPRQPVVDPDADPTPYYEPVLGVTWKDLREYLDFLNRNST